MIWYFSGLEKFVVRGYTKSVMKANTIADLRWWMFSKYTTEVAKLPSTLSALKSTGSFVLMMQQDSS